MPTPRPLPTVIGPAENALRALLAQTLAATAIGNYQAWVVLNAAGNANATIPHGGWQQAAADALKVDAGELADIFAQLHAAGLLGADGALTALGTTELTAARSAVALASARLLDGIDDEAQATTRQVLDHMRRRAEELLHP